MIGSALLGLVLGWFGTMPLAGPGSILFLRRATAGHRRASLGLAAGIALAEALYAGLAAFGYGFMIDAFPILKRLLADLSVLIMVGLGAYFLASGAPSPHSEAEIKKSGGWGFGLGLTVVLVNPAILVNWSAALALLHGWGLGPENRAREAAWALGVGAGIMAWFLTLETLLHPNRGRIPARAISAAIRVMGALLLILGLIGLARIFRR
jgi:threonine/homoserine/homoserine lactone efflux protein